MICFLDMDGILTDFVSAACKAHGKDYPKVFNGYGLPEALGMEDNSFFWEKFCTEDFWANLDWMPDGQKILELVESTFNDICIMTSPTRNPRCASGKLIWIEKHIPQYYRKYFIGPRKWLAASPNKILIDDSDRNIKNFKLCGGSGILVPRIWNENKDKKTLPYLEEALSCF